MKKCFYILKSNNFSFVILENEKIKYFNYNDESSIKDLENYLKDKIEYEKLGEIRQEDVTYYNEDYKVIEVNLLDMRGIKDNSIRGLNLVNGNNIEYRDIKLLQIFCNDGCRLCNLKEVKLNKEEKESTLISIIIAGVMAFIIAIFFIGYDKLNYFGVSVPIIIIGITIGAIISIGKVKTINYSGIYFIVISILLSFTYGIFTNELFRKLNIFLIPISLGIGLYMVCFPDVKLKVEDLLHNILPSYLLEIFYSPYFDKVGKLLKEKKKFKIKDNKYFGVLKGILYSIPLLIVLILLLCSADSMFKSFFEDTILRSLLDVFNFNIKGIIMKISVFIIAFIYLYYVFSMFKFRKKNVYTKKIKLLDKSMVNTILILINALYLSFTYIQVKYLFLKANSSNLSPEWYSNYARSGFFQLIAVVILNIIIILYFKNRIENNKSTTILSTIMTTISINMAVTSMYKMNLYINNFGMTRLRFLTSIFMIFILIMLVIIALSLWKSIELFKHFIIIGSIIYLGINFCNMDKIIAKYNLESYGNDVDINYLSTLSLDSYDVVLDAYKEKKISYNEFKIYIDQKESTSKWYEYNYYNDKMKNME